MNFNEMYRVMVKRNSRFIGTGRTDAGEITFEDNIIHQTFYSHENAKRVKRILEEAGYEVKLKKGGK